MKRLCMLLALCILMSMTTAFAEARFPDMPEEHWAYTAVEKMVNDGRVNGFPDGEFKPDELVTRWQFAKMAGGDPDLMSEPDRPATRDEAALYLWERAGKPENIAPSIVTQDSNYKEAVAWAYTRGVMQGDDGLNLRLQSTLTRAEAATLIVRAEDENLPVANFKDTVSPLILERVWNSRLSGIPYQAEGEITNGELARMALLISSGTHTPDYRLMEKQPEFAGEYAKDIQLVAEECLGVEYATEAFMNQKATVQDAMALLCFYTMKQAHESIRFDTSLGYSDVKVTGFRANMAISFARTNEIFLYSDPILHGSETATLQDLAAILTQLDSIVGLTKSMGTVQVTELLKQEYPYPENAENYAYILEDIPVEVYEATLERENTVAEDLKFSYNFDVVLLDFLNRVSLSLPSDVKVEWTYWPSLIANHSDKAILRVGLKIKENPSNLSLNEIFAKNTLSETYTGDNFIIDISTGKPVLDVVIKADKYEVIRAFAGKE